MLYAIRINAWLPARTFFYHGTFFLILTLLMAIGFSSRKLGQKSASRILDLIFGFLIVPVFLAMPLDFLVPHISYFDAYFEMLSSLTTTGASLFDDPHSIPDVLHLYRATISWMGGFLMLVVALGLFQPINLGGFEVYARNDTGLIVQHRIKRADIRARMQRYSISIFPLYFGLTMVMSVLLIVNGDRPLVAVIHAMSTFSTSGISNIGGLTQAHSGLMGEVIIFAFLLFAVSRFMFQQDKDGRGYRLLKSDKEINLMLICVTVIPLLLFARHWSAAYDIDAVDNAPAALSSLWGGAFMVMSFLTTTGFESHFWDEARAWSGLGTTGIILMGLAVMGGGIATTAGGVKLLRIYALYKHGLREMEKLSFPSSVAGSGQKARNIRREGAYAAWVFFMLFLVSIAGLMLLFSLMGIRFEDSLLLSVAGLSTTGPLLNIAGDNSLSYALLDPSAKAVFCVAMILGRLEPLAIIAVLNPNFWRK
ncbi:TrkH family potassium uptake protein [Amylibacter marinus]|nr:potassium transporter TrkG [Amylibacter marinus]